MSITTYRSYYQETDRFIMRQSLCWRHINKETDILLVRKFGDQILVNEYR